MEFYSRKFSSSSLFGIIPLSDPYAALQMFAAGAVLQLNYSYWCFNHHSILYALGGRVFCSWVCPVNIITDAANYLRRKLEFNKIQKKQPASRNIRYWVFGLSLVLSYILGITAFEFISPISMVHRAIIFGLRSRMGSYAYDIFI